MAANDMIDKWQRASEEEKEEEKGQYQLIDKDVLYLNA